MLTVIQNIQPTIPVFHSLIDVQNRSKVILSVLFNENPMYFDQEGNRNYNEPAYQMIITVRDSKTKQIQMQLFNYFDVKDRSELSQYMKKVQNELQTMGFSKIVFLN